MAAFRITVVAPVFVDRHPSPESMTSSEFIVAQHRSTRVTWIVPRGVGVETIVSEFVSGTVRASWGSKSTFGVISHQKRMLWSALM